MKMKKFDCYRADLDQLPEFFSAAELLRVLPISRATAYRQSAQGTIPSLRVGKRVIFSREQLRAWAGLSKREGGASE